MLPARTATNNWVIDHWSSDQGLRQNTVTSLVQTAEGYLWLGTFGGLVRFDGVRFTAFTTRSNPGLGSDRILRLALGKRGEMWIATDRGLVRFFDGQFREWTDNDGRPAGFTNGFAIDSSGGVWLSGSIGGLARFNGEHFERFVDRGMPDGRSAEIVFDREGNLWVEGGGRLFVRRTGSEVFRHIVLRRGSIVAYIPHLLDREGRLWFYTSDGPYRWTGAMLEPFGSFGAGGLFDDRGGGHWLTTGHGLFHRWSDGHTDTIRATPENAIGDVRSMLVDREGTLWVGTTTHGLLRVRPRLFDMYMQADGLASEQVTAVMRSSRGELWVGSSCSGTTVFGLTGVRRLQYPGCVFSLAETADGTVWGGSYGGGLNGVARNGASIRFTQREGLVSGVVLALYADRDSSLWIGTDNGLAHLVRGVFHNYSTADGLPAPQVHYITRDRRGVLWIGTEGGLARLDGTRFRVWTTRDGLPHNHVRAIYQDADGIYWIGTYGGGLGRFDGRRFVTIASDNGLYDDVVSAILEDANGYLWMSGNRGIYRVHRRMLNDFARGVIPQIVSVGYGPSDGLTTAETNGGFQPSAWQDADGRLWFATIRGLATIDPRNAVPNTNVPGVAIEAARVDGRPLPLGGDIRLPSSNRSLEIQYTGLTSVAPELVLFRYQMQGLDTSWVYVGDRRIAYYSRLAPGNYRFVVSAANRDGVWNEAGAAFAFQVLTPFWRSWWFRSAIGLALLAAIGAAMQLRIARLRRANAAQQAFSRQLIAREEHERKRIAGELHDSLGQDLLVLKNRATIALRAGENAHAVQEQLTQIEEIAGEAIRDVRMIAQNLRPYQLDRSGLSAAVRMTLEQVGAATGLTIDARIEEVDELLGRDVAVNLFRIVQEALNNVVKHAGATRVAIELRREANAIHLQIEDNGGGFTMLRDSQITLTPGGLGLSGIGERATIMGGRHQITSTPNHGTRVVVVVPIAEGKAATLPSSAGTTTTTA